MGAAGLVAELFGSVTALVIVPAAFLAILAKVQEKNAFHWLLRAAYTGVFLAMMLPLAPWPWISAHLRWLWIGLHLLVLVASYRRHRGVPFRLESNLRT